MAEVLTVNKDDLLTLRSALMLKVLLARESDVVEVNRAIGLCDVMLGIDSPVSRLTLAERAANDGLKADPTSTFRPKTTGEVH